MHFFIAKPYQREMLRAIPHGRATQHTAFLRDEGQKGGGANVEPDIPTSFTVRDWRLAMVPLGVGLSWQSVHDTDKVDQRAEWCGAA